MLHHSLVLPVSNLSQEELMLCHSLEVNHTLKHRKYNSLRCGNRNRATKRTSEAKLVQRGYNKQQPTLAYNNEQESLLTYNVTKTT